MVVSLSSQTFVTFACRHRTGLGELLVRPIGEGGQNP